MLKTPDEYAELLIDMCFGSKEDALVEVFSAAKVHPQVPNNYWKTVFLLIQKETS